MVRVWNAALYCYYSLHCVFQKSMKISKPNIYFASNNSRRRRYFLILICKMEYRYDDYADGHTQNIQHVSFSLLVIRNNNDDENCFFKVSAHITNTQIENGGVKQTPIPFFIHFHQIFHIIHSIVHKSSHRNTHTHTHIDISIRK